MRAPLYFPVNCSFSSSWWHGGVWGCTTQYIIPLAWEKWTQNGTLQEDRDLIANESLFGFFSLIIPKRGFFLRFFPFFVSFASIL